MDQNVTLLLGLKSSQGMGLIKIIVSDDKNSVNNVTEAPKQELDVKSDPVLGPFADVFEGIGCFRESTKFNSTRMFQLVFTPQEQSLSLRKRQ